MNLKVVFKVLGTVLFWESVLMIPSLIISIIDNSYDRDAFIVTIILLAFMGLMLKSIKVSVNLRKREAYASVALSWLMMSLCGALPYYISGVAPNYIDALFETASGFTTTGATIFANVEILPRSILFWRSFTLWIGGMGVLVFTLALAPSLGARSIFLMRAEFPGPSSGKLVPKLSDTAKILYIIYSIMTGVTIFLFLLGGMPLFDAVIHAFGTAGTGGFSVKSGGLGHYGSSFIEWTTLVLMFLFGINFSLYYAALKGNWKTAIKNDELKIYFIFVILSVLLIFINILPVYNFSISDSIRNSAFQVTSIITTTGFAATDINIWPLLSKIVLMILMVTGACSGSTTGGLKMIRVIILFKSVIREINHTIHPSSVSKIKIGGKSVDDDVVDNTLIFFFTYILILFVSAMILSLDNFDFMTTFSAALASVSNTGSGFELIGPLGNFSQFSNLSKITMTLCMIIGRLEVLPVIALVSPTMWQKQ
ncbi:MAG TPA: potassium transporter KefA [Clostridiales bacterium]|nr:potassium transporter KefA [Clostridiales bacterium]HCS11887.1 potassium transporter KefA [Clostridiales bacterium]